MTSASGAAIRAAFDAAAAGYDADRRRLIPGFDAYYGAALDWLAERLGNRPARVLDLGAGTGLFTALAARVLPQARFELTDLSEAMLAQARQRFANTPRVTLRVMDHRDLDAPDSYDAVISGLSIHHLEDDEKRRVYAACARALRPGGLFVNADPVAGDSPRMEHLYWTSWHDSVRASGLPETTIAAAIERQALDRRAPLAPQLDWLRAAGLADVECRYKNVSFVVIGGLRD